MDLTATLVFDGKTFFLQSLPSLLEIGPPGPSGLRGFCKHAAASASAARLGNSVQRRCAAVHGLGYAVTDSDGMTRGKSTAVDKRMFRALSMLMVELDTVMLGGGSDGTA